jgi:hypothetical protein
MAELLADELVKGVDAVDDGGHDALLMVFSWSFRFRTGTLPAVGWLTTLTR